MWTVTTIYELQIVLYFIMTVKEENPALAEILAWLPDMSGILSYLYELLLDLLSNPKRLLTDL